MKYLSILAAFLCACFAMSSCTEAVEAPDLPEESVEIDNPRTVISMSSEERAVVEMNNKFALETYKKLVENCKDENINMSPLSLSMALSLAANGAQGETRADILRVLGYDNLETANKFAVRLAAELSDIDKKTDFSLANSAWLDNSVDANADFIERCRQSYEADIFKCVLASEEGKDAINGWINDKTKGLIPNFLVAPLPSAMKYTLINALYFKSSWVEKFDKGFTKDAPFRTPDGATVKVPMMNNSDLSVHAVYDTDGAQWVTLPFGNRAYSMVLILPDEGISPEQYIAGLTADAMAELLQARQTCKGLVSLPKFSLKCTYDNLAEIMERMGMTKPFCDGADFSLICPGTYISGIIQKTYIDIDEDGGTASAASMEGGYSSAAPTEKADFVFNRPFAFMIMEESTSAILFMGRIGRP